MLSICALSDLHGVLPNNIEPCDIVIIAGDIVPLDIQRHYIESEDWFYSTFSNWVKELPCDKVIIVAGNHDFYLSRSTMPAINLCEWTNSKCVYLQDSLYTYISNECEVYKIYGTPWCHKFGNWAFMVDNTKLEHIYEAIPENVDILITHDTPYIDGLDLLPPSKWSSDWVKAGNGPLANAIKETKPKLVICGHLHECKDRFAKIGNTKIYKASILDNKYINVYEPTYLEL